LGYAIRPRGGQSIRLNSGLGYGILRIVGAWLSPVEHLVRD
jgi:hypothetical protein